MNETMQEVSNTEKKEYSIADNIKIEFDIQYARGLLHWFADVRLKVPAVKNNLLHKLDPLLQSLAPEYSKYEVESLPKELTSSLRVFGEPLDYNFGKYYYRNSSEIYRELHTSVKFPSFLSEEDVRQSMNERIERIVDNLHKTYQLHTENDKKTKVFCVNYKLDKDVLDSVAFHRCGIKTFDCKFIDFYEKVYYSYSSQGDCFGSYIRFYFPQVSNTYKGANKYTVIGNGDVLRPEHIAKIFKRHNLSSSFYYPDDYRGLLVYDTFAPLSDNFEDAIKKAEELKDILCEEVVDVFKQTENVTYLKVKDEVV